MPFEIVFAKPCRVIYGEDGSQRVVLSNEDLAVIDEWKLWARQGGNERAFSSREERQGGRTVRKIFQAERWI